MALSLLLFGAGAGATLAAGAGDGFESGNTLGWSVTVGDPTLTAADAFRFADLDLRDPHLFVDVPLAGCSDFTDVALPFGLGPALNDQLETAITTDGDGDGLLDASFLALFRPFDAAALGLRLDAGGGVCTAPLAGTVCDVDCAAPPRTTTYDALAAGLCLDAVAGTTGGYAPAVPTVIAPCFVSAAGSGTLDLGGISVPLVDLQIAAGFGMAPVDELTGGLLRGFLSEAAADTVALPADLPVIGGQPLSILLPGGQGNCAATDDRDLHLGTTGWWFYLEWRGERVSYVGPPILSPVAFSATLHR